MDIEQMESQEKIGVAEIVELLKRYQKTDLQLWNDIEGQHHNIERSRQSRDVALFALEQAINSYIDKRIEIILKRYGKLPFGL